MYDNYVGAHLAWLDVVGCAEQAQMWAIDPAKVEIEQRVAHLMYYEWGAKSVLDVGCGCGRFALQLPHERFVGIDQSLPMITVAEKKVAEAEKHANCTFIRARAEHIKLDETFDLGIAMHVTQHLVEPEGFMKQVIANYKCKRWCFTMLMVPEGGPKLFNIGKFEAACARTEADVMKIVNSLPLKIEGQETQQASGVEEAREMIFWGVLK
jgi:SAM-dependent methyltransferase